MMCGSTMLIFSFGWKFFHLKNSHHAIESRLTQIWIKNTYLFFSWVFFLVNFFFLYFCCWHYCRCPHFPSYRPLLPAPAPPSLQPSPHCFLCLRVIHICSLANPFPFFHPVPPTPPLWQLSVCSVHPCLCFYFVFQFILLIRRHV